MRSSLPQVLILSALASACSTTQKAATNDPAPAQAATQAEATQLSGVVAPAEFTALSIWPEEYAGELLVLEVQPQGTPVAAGDVLARLDTRAIDEQIQSAELELTSARVKHEALQERNTLAEEAAAARLARARAGLERARRSLEGYENFELAFAKRVDELSQQRDKARADDQTDELGQLQAMYDADELTDATEEIVLKREQRNLALLQEGNALSADRRTYRNDYELAMEAETRRESVEQKQLELDHLVRTQATEKAVRDDDQARSSAQLAKKDEHLAQLRRDRELLTIQAPHAGTLLHGKQADYRPGKSPTRLQRASKIAPRSDALMVMQPGKLAVTLDIGESSLETFASGTKVMLSPLSGAGDDVEGKLSVSAYPTGQSGKEATHEGKVVITSAASGWIVGMHVSVEPASSAPDASQPAGAAEE